jgi:hypothetical protein
MPSPAPAKKPLLPKRTGRIQVWHKGAGLPPQGILHYEGPTRRVNRTDRRKTADRRVDGSNYEKSVVLGRRNKVPTQQEIHDAQTLWSGRRNSSNGSRVVSTQPHGPSSLLEQTTRRKATTRRFRLDQRQRLPPGQYAEETVEWVFPNGRKRFIARGHANHNGEKKTKRKHWADLVDDRD